MTGIRRLLSGPAAPVPVTVISGSDRALVATAAGALHRRLRQDGIPAAVLIDQMVPGDLPPGLDGTVVAPPPLGPPIHCPSCLLRRRLLAPLARAIWTGMAGHVILVASAVVGRPVALPHPPAALAHIGPRARLSCGGRRLGPDAPRRPCRPAAPAGCRPTAGDAGGCHGLGGAGCRARCMPGGSLTSMIRSVGAPGPRTDTLAP